MKFYEVIVKVIVDADGENHARDKALYFLWETADDEGSAALRQYVTEVQEVSRDV